MSVSRVEYDAALKRVQNVCCGTIVPGEPSPCYEDVGCGCIETTLAALGLDEPPAEESWSSGTGGLNADWSRLPDVEPLGTCAVHGNYWTPDCLRCGIDGGTA